MHWNLLHHFKLFCKYNIHYSSWFIVAHGITMYFQQYKYPEVLGCTSKSTVCCTKTESACCRIPANGDDETLLICNTSRCELISPRLICQVIRMVIYVRWMLNCSSLLEYRIKVKLVVSTLVVPYPQMMKNILA
jgi:hypothetical protein